jgi:hypothetical protein
VAFWEMDSVTLRFGIDVPSRYRRGHYSSPFLPPSNCELSMLLSRESSRTEQHCTAESDMVDDYVSDVRRGFRKVLSLLSDPVFLYHLAENDRLRNRLLTDLMKSQRCCL